MNERFIDEVADLLLQNHPEDLDKICVVFPNRRAALFLKQSLAKKAKKILWSPEVFATKDFVADVCELKIADNLQLLFMFFEVYTALKGNEADSFEIFSQWASGLLHDFNEIDLYAENPKALFEYLNEAKAIELWAQNFSELTSLQKNYLEFWQMLSKLYHQFREKLASQSLAYSGMAFRAIAAFNETQFIKPNRKHIYFAGFNALTKAESDFMKKLCKAGLASMIWDADHHYFDETMHEAGYFLRRIAQEWKDITTVSPQNLLKEKDRNIQIIGVAKNIAQAQTAGRIINKLLSEGESLSDIALVLADETLLLPQLEFLPQNVDKVNITMGYPLQATSAAVLLKQIIKLHIESMKLSERLNQKEAMFYSSSFLRLLKHPLIAILFDSDSRANEIEEKIFSEYKNKSVYIEATRIADEFKSFGIDEAFIAVFQKTSASAIEFIELIASFFDNLLQKQISKKVFPDELGIESIFQLKKIITQTNDLALNYKIELSLVGLEKLLSGQIAGQSISFYGEPLEGLQIMGMLETRCLDFKHIIMLSVNEDILPKGRSNNSFIPIDIKKQFGLPVFTDSDAVFSYHFYRLLQRSENAYLLYNTEPDEMGKGEASRFILQLQHELKDCNTKITKSIAPSDVISDDISKEIIVEKSDEIMEVLQKNAAYGFSPSALNAYLTCSLRYYLKYVMRINKADDFNEAVGMDEMGSAVHKVLEDIYGEFQGKNIDREYIKAQNEKLQSILKPVLRAYVGGKSLDFGRNKLFALVAENITHAFLNTEIDDENMDSTQLVSVESKLETQLELPNSDLFVKLSGSADRIDKKGELVRVIDYKTGTVNARKLKYTDLESLLDVDKDTAKVLQLLMYAYIYLKENIDTKAVQPSIFGLRYKGNNEMPLNFMNEFQINRNDLREIEIVLQTIVSSIFDKDLPFNQTEDKSSCEYCDFISVCNRF